jgi:hypothetical protein
VTSRTCGGSQARFAGARLTPRRDFRPSVRTGQCHLDLFATLFPNVKKPRDDGLAYLLRLRLSYPFASLLSKKDWVVGVAGPFLVNDQPTFESLDSRARASASAPHERPASVKASARSRRSFSGGGSEPAKRRARECVGGPGAKPPDQDWLRGRATSGTCSCGQGRVRWEPPSFDPGYDSPAIVVGH